jgi:hypothetical protein
MSSLRSLILASRIAPFSPVSADPAVDRIVIEQTVGGLRDRSTTLVNAQKVYEDVRAAVDRQELWCARESIREKIPQPKPPYRKMWIESMQEFGRAGMLVERQASGGEWDSYRRAAVPPDHRGENAEEYLEYQRSLADAPHPTDLVLSYLWIEQQGEARAIGSSLYWLEESGDYVYSVVIPFVAKTHPQIDDVVVSLQCEQLWLLATMARLNCHNVGLKPAPAPAKKPKRSWDKTPMSVWHEIVVKPSPLLARAQREDPTDAEKHAVRLHKVRGHFADYRRSAGLFGKWKILVWVDEHEAGDAESGTVVSRYRVE